jgi:hypothetical protein
MGQIITVGSQGRHIGGKPARSIDRRTLRLATFLPRVAHLPPIPPTFDLRPTGWTPGPMLLNDKEGICVPVAGLHFVRFWTASVGAPVEPTEADAQAIYEHFGFNPNAPLDANGNNPTDNGVCMLDFLKYWKNNGIAGHKIGGFASVDYHNLPVALWGMYNLGGIFTGVTLTDADAQANGQWIYDPDDVSPVDGGHGIAVLPVNAGSRTTAETWGQDFVTDFRWLQARSDEAYVVFSPDQLSPETGLSEIGLDVKALNAALAEVLAEKGLDKRPAGM